MSPQYATRECWLPQRVQPYECHGEEGESVSLVETTQPNGNIVEQSGDAKADLRGLWKGKKTAHTTIITLQKEEEEETVINQRLR